MFGTMIVCALTFYEVYSLFNLIVSNTVHLEFYEPLYGEGDVYLVICQIFFEVLVHTSAITFSLAANFGLLKEFYGKVLFYCVNICSFIVGFSSSLGIYLHLYYNYPLDLELNHYTKCIMFHALFGLCSMCLTINALVGNVQLFDSTLEITECESSQTYKSFENKSDLKEMEEKEFQSLGVFKV